MSDTIIKKIYEDVEFLKKKIIDLDLKLESSLLEYDELTPEEIYYFEKVFNETKNVDFWIPRGK